MEVMRLGLAERVMALTTKMHYRPVLWTFAPIKGICKKKVLNCIKCAR